MVLSAILIHGLQATEYHVSPAGDDTGSGSVQSPFRTIAKASSVLTAGDICVIHAGTYRETVIATSGTGSAPVVYRSAPGEVVTISGCDLVKGWSPHAGKIYKAPWNAPLGRGNQVFVDGRMSFQARWPDMAQASLLAPPLAIADEGSTKTTITCPLLPRTDLSGAEVWVMSGCRWESWTSRIQSSAPGRMTFENKTYDSLACRPCSEFYVFGAMELLDAENEWFLRDGQLYLWAPGGVSPNDHEVEGKVRTYGFDLSGRHDVRIEGIGLLACSIKTDSRTKAIEIDRMTARHISHWEGEMLREQADAFALWGADVVIRNSEFSGAAGTLVGMHGSDNCIVNCLVENSGYSGINSSCIEVNGTMNVVSHTTVKNSGRSVIGVSGRRCIIEHNDVSGAGLLTSDVGLFTTGAADGMRSEIRYNWFHDNLSRGLARGIFLSTGSCNFLIHHNAVWNCWEGGYHGEPPSEYIQLFNNTFYTTPGSYDAGGVDISSFTFIDDQVGCMAVNNIFTDDIRTFGHDVVTSHNLLPGTNPQFVDAKAADFRIRRTSPAVGAGVHLPGITTSPRPDLGAYEGGSWKPGHDFSKRVEANREPSASPFWNQVRNGGFEQGLEGWEKLGAAEGVQPQELGADPTLNINGAVHGNRGAVRLAGGACGVSQLTAKLQPGSSYLLTGWAKLSSKASSATMSVKGEGIVARTVDFNGPGQYPGVWLRRSIVIQTGRTEQPVTISAQKTSAGSDDQVLMDDIGLVKVMSPPQLITIARAECETSRGSGLNQFDLSGHWSGPRSWTKDSSATVRFDGSAIVLYAQIAESGGIAAVSIDDGPEELVDTYYPQLPHHATIQPTTVVYRSPVLKDGPHILKVRVTGKKNASSKGATIRPYAVDILRAP